MPQQLFVFIQLEFPWTLGPADGRYLIRREDDGEPERVVVLAEHAASIAAEKSRAIKRITGQTRILALNAMIEAARAGERWRCRCIRACVL